MHPRIGAGGKHVARAFDVAELEIRPRPPLAEVGGKVKCDPGAGCCRGERSPVCDVAPNWLSPQRGDPFGRGLRARQRSH